jgi:Uma2 family endonuclease
MTREEMKQIKEERGYSLKMLSDYSGVPVVTLQKIFSGETLNPRKATLDAIEKVLTADEKQYMGKAYEYASNINDAGMLLNDSEAYVYAVDKTKKQGEYTLEDYYALPDDRRVELIDGVFYDMTSPSYVHQELIGYFYLVFHNHIQKKKKPCKVLLSPLDVQLDCDNRTMVEPDLLVVCGKDKLRDFGIYGAPDFVLEILSKSTRKKDMTLKLSKYMTAGVREYWIVDPFKETLITYNFMEEDFLPHVYPLEGSVPVAISENELLIDLEPIAELIRDFNITVK